MLANIFGIGPLKHDNASVVIDGHNANGDARKQLADDARVPERIKNAGITDVLPRGVHYQQGLVGWVRVDDGLIVSAVIIPCDRMRRYAGCAS